MQVGQHQALNPRATYLVPNSMDEGDLQALIHRLRQVQQNLGHAVVSGDVEYHKPGPANVPQPFRVEIEAPLTPYGKAITDYITFGVREAATPSGLEISLNILSRTARQFPISIIEPVTLDRSNAPARKDFHDGKAASVLIGRLNRWIRLAECAVWRTDPSYVAMNIDAFRTIYALLEAEGFDDVPPQMSGKLALHSTPYGHFQMTPDAAAHPYRHDGMLTPAGAEIFADSVPRFIEVTATRELDMQYRFRPHAIREPEAGDFKQIANPIDAMRRIRPFLDVGPIFVPTMSKAA